MVAYTLLPPLLCVLVLARAAFFAVCVREEGKYRKRDNHRISPLNKIKTRIRKKENKNTHEPQINTTRASSSQYLLVGGCSVGYFDNIQILYIRLRTFYLPSLLYASYRHGSGPTRRCWYIYVRNSVQVRGCCISRDDIIRRRNSAFYV